MENLKPCPFCGGKAKVKAAKKDNEELAIENIDSCKNEAIETWNRRAKSEGIN